MKPRFPNRCSEAARNRTPQISIERSSTRFRQIAPAKSQKIAPNDIFAAVFALAALCALPPLLFKIAMARRDLAMRNRFLPFGAPLSPDARILILAPHPDDETLGTGGLIARARRLGIEVRVVFLTNGDGSGSTKIGETVRRRQTPDYRQIAQMRQREATAALGELGLAPHDIVFLGFPDGGLRALWQTNWRDARPFRSKFTGADRVRDANAPTPNAVYSGQSALREVTRALENFRPTHVLATDGNDTHADHRAAFCLALAAIEHLKTKSSTRSWAAHIEFQTYLIHHAIWPLPHGFRPDDALTPPAVLSEIGARWFETPLDLATRAAKKAALARYQSQLTWTPNYLRGFLRRNELFATTSPTRALTQIEAAPTEAAPTEFMSPEFLPSIEFSNAGTAKIEVVETETARALLAAKFAAPQDVSPGAEISSAKSEFLAASAKSRTRNQEEIFATPLLNVPILRDPRADSLLRRTFPAADLRALHAKIADENVCVVIEMQAAPSPKIVYEISIHRIGGDVETSEIFAFEMRFCSGIWRAFASIDAVKGSTKSRRAVWLPLQQKAKTDTVSAHGVSSQREFAARATSNAIEIDIPLDFLRGGEENCALLLATSTRYGARLLDKTSTVAVRI